MKRQRRLSTIVNLLRCDRFGLAKYPERMAGRYQNIYLSRMENGKRVYPRGDDGFPDSINYEKQTAWIRANRLPHPENK
jgi:hypothetical protein